MPVYSVEGKLGTGKTKFCVWRAQRALLEGRRVASNVDLYLDKLVPRLAKAAFVRIPDKPTAEDLYAIGHGNPDSYDEDRNGVLILDELGTWLNSRQFQDKGRAGMLDWLIHARKLGWDVYLIVQSAQMIDKQARELIEYDCRCVRLDKVRIPVVGKLLGAVFGGRVGYLPRMHLVTARVGEVSTSKVVAERWMYRGDELHAAYDTRQVFRSDYPHGSHSVLPQWEPAPPRLGVVAALRRWLAERRTARTRSGRAVLPKLAAVEALRELPADARIAAWWDMERAGGFACETSGVEDAGRAELLAEPAHAA